MKSLPVTNLRVTQFTSHLLALGARSKQNGDQVSFDELIPQSRTAAHIYENVDAKHRGALLQQARIRFDALTEPRFLRNTISDSKVALAQVAASDIVFPVEMSPNSSINWRVPIEQFLDAIYHAIGSNINDELNITPSDVLAGLQEYQGNCNELNPLERALLQHPDAITNALNVFFDLPDNQVEILLDARAAIGRAETEYATYLKSVA